MKVLAMQVTIAASMYMWSISSVESRIPFIRDSKFDFGCRKANRKFLEETLKKYGGYNRKLVAADRKTAEKNTRKMVTVMGAKKAAPDFRKTSTYRFKNMLSKTCQRDLKSLMVSSRRRMVTKKEDIVSMLLRLGSRALSQNCMEKGSITQNGNLNLCRSCIQTRTLPSDRFPRYVTEVRCSNGGCFQGQGECVEEKISLVFLKRAAQCLRSRSGFLVEGWEPYEEVVRVGCKCELRQDSFLDNFVR